MLYYYKLRSGSALELKAVRDISKSTDQRLDFVWWKQSGLSRMHSTTIGGVDSTPSNTSHRSAVWENRTPVFTVSQFHNVRS